MIKSVRMRWIIGIVIICVGVFLMFAYRIQKPIFGFTYSAPYAQYLGLDPVPSFEEILQEIPFSFVRIPVYWDRYEPLNDLWQEQELQSLLDVAKQHNVSVILAIGQKVPRWPECFNPSWVKELEKYQYDEEFLAFIERVATQFKDHPALARWQIENESYFPFGSCEILDPALIAKETHLIQSISPYIPIQTTVSGEQGVGLNKVSFADIVGFSIYRTVSSPITGTFVFPHTPFFYRMQSFLVMFTGKESVISELQAEPWNAHEFDLHTVDGLHAGTNAFTADDLKNNIQFAQQTGVREISFWGVEWWLLLAKKGQNQLWEHAKELIE